MYNKQKLDVSRPASATLLLNCNKQTKEYLKQKSKQSIYQCTTKKLKMSADPQPVHTANGNKQKRWLEYMHNASTPLSQLTQTWYSLPITHTRRAEINQRTIMSDPRWTWNSSLGHPGLYGPPLATLGHFGPFGPWWTVCCELYITVIVDANVVQRGGTWNTMGVGPIEFEWKAARPSRFLLIENSQALPRLAQCILHNNTHSKYNIDD